MTTDDLHTINSTKRKRSPVNAEEEQPWCLIESEPGIFTELCSTFGAKEVSVEEVWDVDDLMSKSTYGLILAHRYDESNKIPDGWNEQDEDRDKVFFCCQIVTNICATLALLAVLFNIDHITDIGDHLKELKDILRYVDPKDRGMAIGNDALLRKAHNSFAGLQAKAAAKPKRKKASKKRGRKPKKQDVEEEVVYHYVSYVHVGGFLWELDGMNRVPIKHASCTKENWVDVLRPILRKRMIESGGHDFSMLTVGPAPWTEKGRKDLRKIDILENCIDSKLNELEPNWRNMKDFSIPNITSCGNPLSIVEDRLKRVQLSTLIDAKKELATQRAMVPFDSNDGVKEFNAKLLDNTRRKHDFTPFIQQLISKVHENDMHKEVFNLKK
ncbi:ubiquitin carboxyl-terminal hydrolase [Phascolomyces articulosus]|uniref:ubiquitinyl hydrolase 1 n=1 Tax=Phascolomyces articulosus TaxID=60185 RepID=A0AAD5PGW0_9FUNG|nr:ubiquitin carboxyl-terminal hydrolase [Phascolomyces articulosus]